MDHLSTFRTFAIGHSVIVGIHEVTVNPEIFAVKSSVKYNKILLEKAGPFSKS
jgi:hypothetical protein